jgi:histidinol dehydrogenase
VALAASGDGNLGTAGLLKVAALFSDGRGARDRGVCLWDETVPRADRIVGPGNIYVAAAKKILAGEVGIDFVSPARPRFWLSPPKEIRGISRPTCWRSRARCRRVGDPAHDVQTSGGRMSKELDRQLATLRQGSAAKSIARIRR